MNQFNLQQQPTPASPWLKRKPFDANALAQSALSAIGIRRGSAGSRSTTTTAPTVPTTTTSATTPTPRLVPNIGQAQTTAPTVPTTTPTVDFAAEKKRLDQQRNAMYQHKQSPAASWIGKSNMAAN